MIYRSLSANRTMPTVLEWNRRRAHWMSVRVVVVAGRVIIMGWSVRARRRAPTGQDGQPFRDWQIYIGYRKMFYNIIIVVASTAAARRDER